MSDLFLPFRHGVDVGLRGIARACPSSRFKALLRNHLRFWCSSTEEVVSTRWGFRIAASPRDYLTYAIYFYREYECAMSQFISSHLRPGQVAMDLGANHGWFSLLMSSAVGPTGKVYSFEPYPPLYASLRSNILLNGHDWVVPNAVAIANKSGLASFVIPELALPDRDKFLDECSGVGHLSTSAADGQVEVPITTLDDYVSEKGIRSLQIVKIDVEGAELDVLTGGETSITSLHPIIVIEYNQVTALREGYSIKDVDTMLKEYGYDRYTYSSVLKRLDIDYWMARRPEDAILNVYCFPQRV